LGHKPAPPRGRADRRGMMEARATARYVRVSPRKIRQLVDEVRGTDVGRALDMLDYASRPVAKTVSKLIRSAVANAVNMEGRVEVDDLYVKELTVGDGPRLKRWVPRARGRATPIIKRSSHITVVVAERKSAEAD
jgi:large subunit ribosomal protein L22